MAVRLTRRGFLARAGAGAGAAAVTLAPDAPAQQATVRTFIGKTAAELTALNRDALADGFGLVSLSLYGPERAPLYAAVMSRRPSPVGQRHWLALTAAELDKILAEQAAQGFGPAIIAATGPAAQPRFALVCEPQNPPWLIRPKLKSGSSTDKATIEGMNRQARRDGRILRCVAAYGGAADLRFAAIWAPNPDKIVWNADGIADTAAVYRAREQAHASAWCRPVLVAPDPASRYLSVFVDDQVDHWAAETDLAADALTRALADWERKGHHPVSIQAAGASARTARFAAVLVRDDTILPRRWSATGPAANAEIDGVMKSVMTRSRIRQASLAIVRGARLVYARGYTFAEEGWPVTQPTTCFRLASVSKTVTALAIYQLIERRKLNLSDRMQDILGLRTPAGGPPKDKRFNEITIEQLLAHKSGLVANQTSLEVRGAYKAAHPDKAWHLPVSPEMTDAYIAARDLASPPGKTSTYNNCAYYLLARIVAKLHGEATPMAALRRHLLEPLGIKRCRRARSLLAAQEPDEARYSTNSNRDGQRDIPLRTSVMSDDQQLVPIGYGSGQLEISEGAGGLTAAMTDMARLIAILIDQKDNPALRRETLTQMLTNAAARRGHGFDAAKDLGSDQFYAQKVGALSTSSNVLQMHGEYGFALCWAGVPDADVRWYPDFPAVMSIARGARWSNADLFEQFGMSTL
jgi:CubicO group peptidase (beta-lactamase class C family)